jgi:hypothetical protein
MPDSDAATSIWSISTPCSRRFIANDSSCRLHQIALRSQYIPYQHRLDHDEPLASQWSTAHRAFSIGQVGEQLTTAHWDDAVNQVRQQPGLHSRLLGHRGLHPPERVADVVYVHVDADAHLTAARREQCCGGHSATAAEHCRASSIAMP